MKPFFILLLVFTCSFSSADHDDTRGFDYNGRTFSCKNFRRAKDFAETLGDQKHLYEWALCQLHRGFLQQGIKTSKEATAKGSYMAGIIVFKYYLSDEYKFIMGGRTTEDEVNLQKAIDYMEKALQIIRFKPNYPFGDEEELKIEKEQSIYLVTLDDLAASYINLFGTRISAHIQSINENIGDGTLEPLRKAEEVAQNCLDVTYKPDVWDEKVFSKKKKFCHESKEVAKDLIPLEKIRLDSALKNCKDIKLHLCEAHNQDEGKVYDRFMKYSFEVNKLLNTP